MAWRKINDTKLTAIANAIRGKTGKTAALTLDAMPTEIAAITTGVDTSADTVVADVLTEGYTAHDAAGNLVNGANPYEKEETDITVNTQASLIAQIQTALEGKAAGGGMNTATITFTVNDIGSIKYYNTEGALTTLSSGGQVVIPVPAGVLLRNGCTSEWGASGSVEATLLSGSGTGAGYVMCWVYGDCAINTGGR